MMKNHTFGSKTLLFAMYHFPFCNCSSPLHCSSPLPVISPPTTTTTTTTTAMFIVFSLFSTLNDTPLHNVSNHNVEGAVG
jgi:hypothetical protein